jgi:hypothetical protein
MDAILFKMLKGYTLSLDGDIDNLFAISNGKLAEEHGLHFLSEENCNKIFDLIDVIELADNYSKGIIENQTSKFMQIYEILRNFPNKLGKHQ